MHLIIIPRDLAPELHEPLRTHYRDNPSIRVIVERRTTGDPRSPAPRLGRRASDRNRPIRAHRGHIAASWPQSPPPEAIPHLARLRYMREIEAEAIGVEDVESLRLVSAFQAGDDDAFDELYIRHYAGIYGFIRAMLDDADLAEDVTQEVFMAVHAKLAEYRAHPGVPFLAWLRTVARNHAFSRLRRPRDPEPRDPHDLAETSGRSEAWLGEQALMTIIEHLPSRDQQRAFVLREIVGLSVSETAALMGKTENAIKQLSRRARAGLRKETRDGDTPPDRPPDQIAMRRRPSQSRVLRERRAALHAFGY